MSAIGLILLLTSVAADGPQIEVSTLQGSAITGRLETLDGKQLTVRQDDRTQSMPTDGLLQLRLVDSGTVTAAGPIAVSLADGSKLRGGNLTVTAKAVNLQHPQLGPIAVPREQVRNLRLAADDPVVAAAWDQLVQRESKNDQIVIRKGDVLDHIDGVVGTIDDTSVKFLLDGEDVTVKRERVFGVVYAKRDAKPASRSIKVELAGDEFLFAGQVAFKDGQWELTWPGKELLRVPPAAIRGIDFSAGKVVYLSTIEPRDVEEVPYFLIMFPYQRDRSLEGQPLKVGQRSFTRGLAIHSKTRLRYRLGGEYRRFTAEAGIDPEISNADTLLKIIGDGKTLFEKDFTAVDPPQSLDIPVDGVVELEIVVDYGRDRLDIGDRIHLGDARVTK